MYATATAIATSVDSRYATREEWLRAAIEALAGLFEDKAGVTLPPVRVSVGWPGGNGRKATVIGQCWPTGASADKTSEVFISPTQGDAARVLDILVHELVHAVDDCANGHKAAFRKIAVAVGLEGKMTATTAGDELKLYLTELVEDVLGAYPHAVLMGGAKGADSPAKQGTRMLKVECPVDGYVVRTTAKWLEIGLPSCPCGAEMARA